MIAALLQERIDVRIISSGVLPAVRAVASELGIPTADGATELEAKPAVDLFVAFAGVAARPNVMAAADVVIRQNRMARLALALDRAPQHEPARSIYHRGAALLEANHSE